MEQTKSLEIALSMIRMVFLFFIRSKTTIENNAMMEDHIMELFSRPLMKSDPLRKTIYPDRNTPEVRTMALLVIMPSNKNKS